MGFDPCSINRESVMNIDENELVDKYHILIRRL